MTVTKAAKWQMLSPTHHDEIAQIQAGTASPELILKVKGKYSAAIEAQASRTAGRLQIISEADVADCVQRVLLAFWQHDFKGFRIGSEREVGSFRKFLCGLIRNQSYKELAAIARAYAVSHLLKEAFGEEAIDATQTPVRLSQEMGYDEQLAACKEALAEWLALKSVRKK